MTNSFTRTHIGWYWLCPIEVDMRDEDCPSIRASSPWLGWWFDAQTVLDYIKHAILEWVDVEYEPGMSVKLAECIEGNWTTWEQFQLYWVVFWTQEA